MTDTDDNSKTMSRHAVSIAAPGPSWELTWEQLARRTDESSRRPYGGCRDSNWRQ